MKQRKTKTIIIRVTEEQKAQFQKRADILGQTLSKYIRTLLNLND